MNTNDNAERRLRSWLADEGQVGETTQLFDAVANGSRGIRQRPGLVVRLRSGGMGSGSGGVLGSAATRRIGSLVLVALLIALLAAGAVLVGSQLLTPSPTLPIPADRGVFTPTGSLAIGRIRGLTATLLRDGRVLIVGGGGDLHRDSAAAEAEIWDPTSGAFSPAGSMSVGRYGHTATLLRDGRVLVAGGVSNGDAVASAELWDPATSTFSTTGALALPRSDGSAQLLSDGRVLVVNYQSTGAQNPTLGAEVWDPATGRWSPGDSLPEARDPAGVRLHDGRILLIDHNWEDAVSTVFDPTTDASTHFAPWPDFFPTPHMSITAAILGDGRVLVMGGQECDLPPEGSLTASIETAISSGPICTVIGTTRAAIWDPATSMFSATGPLLEVRDGFTAVLLADGRVLIVGGTDGNQGIIPAAEVFELK